MSSDRNLDWNKTSPALPYIWADLEKEIYELSDSFLPGDISVNHVSALRQFFTTTFQSVLPTDQSAAQYDAFLQGCPLQYTLTQPSGPARRSPMSTLLAAGRQAALLGAAESPVISSEAVYAKVFADLHVRGREGSRQIISSLLFYVLGLPLGADATPLPLRPDVVVARSLLLFLHDRHTLFFLLVELFLAECRTCTQMLTNLQADTTQNASKQLSTLLITLIQLLHLVLASLNITETCIFMASPAASAASGVHRQSDVYNNEAIRLEPFCRDVIAPLCTLLMNLMQVDSSRDQSTFNNTTARCVASYRPISLLRHALLQFVGAVGDHRQAQKCREARKAAVRAGALSAHGSMASLTSSPGLGAPGAPGGLSGSGGSAGSGAPGGPGGQGADASGSQPNLLLAEAKQVRRLPPPRFRGYVNPSSQMIQQISSIYENAYAPAYKDACLHDPYVAPDILRQDADTTDMLQAFQNKLSTRRKLNGGLINDITDVLSGKKLESVAAVFQLFPKPEIRGSLYSIKELHGAYLAMRFACDSRGWVNPTLSASASTGSLAGAGLGAAVLGGSRGNVTGLESATMLNVAALGDRDQPGSSPVLTEPLVGNSVLSPDYELYQARLRRGITAPFPYSGRPVPNGNLGYFKGCVDKVFAFEGTRLAILEKGEVLGALTRCLPLDAERSLLTRVQNEDEYLVENQFALLLRHVDVPAFLAALLRLSQCAVPQSLDAVLSSRSAATTNTSETKGVFSNNSPGSIRHVREAVLKCSLHIVLLLQLRARFLHPSFGIIVNRIIQRCNVSGCGIDSVVCVMSLPVAAYVLCVDARTHMNGTCLFMTQIGADALCQLARQAGGAGVQGVQGAQSGPGPSQHGSNASLASGVRQAQSMFPYTEDELASEAGEFMQQRQMRAADAQTVDQSRALTAYASPRRLFCVLTAARCFYAFASHSVYRAQEGILLYTKISSNFISCILQSSSSNTASGGGSAAGAGSGAAGAGDLSQTTVFTKGLNKLKANLTSLGGQGAGAGAGAGAQKRQSTMTYVQGNLKNMLEFLHGNNSMNNPAKINTSGTLTCNFPGYQLSKLNNISSVVILLKIARHILPLSTLEDNRSFNLFEPPGLSTFREFLTRLIYQLAISPASEDSWRWNREIVAAGSSINYEMERRAIAAFMDRYVFRGAEGFAQPHAAWYAWLYEPNADISPESVVEEQLAISQISTGWVSRHL